MVTIYLLVNGGCHGYEYNNIDVSTVFQNHLSHDHFSANSISTNELM